MSKIEESKRFGLSIETGTERTTIIVDILDIIQTVRNTGIRLKIDESSGGSHKEVRGKLVSMVPTCATCQGYGSQILLMHNKIKKRYTRLDQKIRKTQGGIW